MNELLMTLYFFLPAYIANMAPPMFKWLPWNYPLDFKLKYKDKRLLGDNKTMKGFLGGVLLGTLVFFIQKSLGIESIIDYSAYSIWLGVTLSVGALLGDATESFFKRRIGIEPGKPWIPFDQLDFVVGALILSLLFYTPSIITIMILMLLSPILQLLFHYLGYLLKINKDRI